MALKRFSGNPEYTKAGLNGRQLANNDIIPFTHNPDAENNEDGKVKLSELKQFFNDEQDTEIARNQSTIAQEIQDRQTADTQLDNKITAINNKISNEASDTNKLADKAFIAETYINKNQLGAKGGVATLNTSGKIPEQQLPSYVDDVLEYASQSNFPSPGETGKIYVAKDTNKIYRWSGSQYTVISETLALGETSSTAYRGDRGKIAYDHSQNGDAHVTTDQKTNWNTAYTHSQTAHAPSNAERNIITTIKGNGTALTVDSNRAVNITPSNIGAVATTGGTITGDLAVNGILQLGGTDTEDFPKGIKIGDGDNCTILETEDDKLTINASQINLDSEVYVSDSLYVDGVNVMGAITSATGNYFGTTNTLTTSTRAITSSINGFTSSSLIQGQKIYVKFSSNYSYVSNVSAENSTTNVVTQATGATLNISNTGAKNIKIGGEFAGEGFARSGEIHEFIYDGTYWNDITATVIYKGSNTRGNYIKKTNGLIEEWNNDFNETWKGYRVLNLPIPYSNANYTCLTVHGSNGAYNAEYNANCVSAIQTTTTISFYQAAGGTKWHTIGY